MYKKPAPEGTGHGPVISQDREIKKMASPEVWLEVLAWTKALFETTKASIDVFATYRKCHADKDTIQEARRVSTAYSTYSQEEVKALLRRLEGCRDRFIEQGSGQDRAQCLCSVLNEARIGNGGKFPEIDDWSRIYSELNCTT